MAAPFSLGAAESAPEPSVVARAADQGILPGSSSALSAITYARAQHGQRLPLADFPSDWAIRPAPYDAAADYIAAVSAGRVEAWLDTLPPPDPRYGRLVRAYARYRAIADRGGWPPLTARSTLAPGAQGAEVDALRARLAIEDSNLPAPKPPGQADPPPTYDADLAAAVSRAQARYGLTPDGRAGHATITALNAPVEARLVQIRANLERWRWAPRALPPFRIEVNTADASLELFAPPAQTLAMRAIVGRAGKATPMFQDKVSAIVFNPPWNVPADIAAKEIWPKIRRNPDYMAREHFVVKPGGGLMQRPGPKCALGTIKFDLGNAFGVYLHDTPARSLFALDRRALSHGCMRLADPTDLARRLLAGDPDWPDTRINLTLLDGATVRAPLKNPTPVLIFYWTAFVDEDGGVQFRPDVYGWDAKLSDLLARRGQAL